MHRDMRMVLRRGGRGGRDGVWGRHVGHLCGCDLRGFAHIGQDPQRLGRHAWRTRQGLRIVSRCGTQNATGLKRRGRFGRRGFESVSCVWRIRRGDLWLLCLGFMQIGLKPVGGRHVLGLKRGLRLLSRGRCFNLLCLFGGNISRLFSRLALVYIGNRCGFGRRGRNGRRNRFGNGRRLHLAMRQNRNRVNVRFNPCLCPDQIVGGFGAAKNGSPR